MLNLLVAIAFIGFWMWGFPEQDHNPREYLKRSCVMMAYFPWMYADPAPQEGVELVAEVLAWSHVWSLLSVYVSNGRYSRFWLYYKQQRENQP